jgi:hypothetical protein
MEERHKVRVIPLSIELCHHRMHDSASLSSSTSNKNNGVLTASKWSLKEVAGSERGKSFDVVGEEKLFLFLRLRKRFLEREFPARTRDLPSKADLPSVRNFCRRIRRNCETK